MHMTVLFGNQLNTTEKLLIETQSKNKIKQSIVFFAVSIAGYIYKILHILVHFMLQPFVYWALCNGYFGKP